MNWQSYLHSVNLCGTCLFKKKQRAKALHLPLPKSYHQIFKFSFTGIFLVGGGVGFYKLKKLLFYICGLDFHLLGGHTRLVQSTTK